MCLQNTLCLYFLKSAHVQLVLCKSVRQKMTESSNYFQFEILFLINEFQ